MMWFVGWPRVNNKQTNRQTNKSSHIQCHTHEKHVGSRFRPLKAGHKSPLHISRNYVLANSEDNLPPFELQSFSFPLRAPFISLQKQGQKGQQGEVFSRQYLFCSLFPRDWMPPRSQSLWKSAGPDIASQIPVLVTEKLWSLLFLSGHKSWPSRDGKQQCVPFPNTAGSEGISHLKLLNTRLTRFWTPPVDCRGLV